MTLESSWQEMLTSVGMTAEKLARNLKQRQSRSVQANVLSAQTLWLIGLTGFVVATFNWRLLLAMSVGAGSVRLAYWLADDAHWQLIAEIGENLWQQIKQPAVLAGAGGFTATLGTYGVLSLWATIDNPWLALGLLTPTALSIATLALLLWQFKAGDSDKGSDPHQLLGQLTQPDPLRRLVAIQQLLHWVEQAPAAAFYTLSVRSQITDCFRVLLVQESDPIVRNALRQGLRSLAVQSPQLGKGAPPLQLEAPIKTVEQRSPLRRSQVEYVESIH